MEPHYGFARRVLVANAITVLFVGVTLFAWANFRALLIVFAGVLLAILLFELAVRLARPLRLPHGVALALVVLLLAAAVAAAVWLGAAPIERQVVQLLDSLPRAIDSLRVWVTQYPALQSALPSLPTPGHLLESLPRLLPDAGPLFSGALGVLTGTVVIGFVGIYLAAQPQPYVRALMLMVPPAHRQRAAHVLQTLGNMLGRWLVGKALAMLIVGLMTTVGLSLLGIPLAMVLGLIAGLLDFIPYLGPLLAAVPAVLVAFSQSPLDALYTALLFLGIQTAEGYLLIPLIERRAIALPPAVTIVVQLLLGSLAGLTGVALATPVTAVVVVLVTMLYVQDVLEVPVKPPGEP